MAIGSRTATAALHRRLSSAESLQSIRNSAIDLDDVPISVADQTGPITWMALPRKGQLAILFLCRFVDFLQVASLQAYAYYQLKSLNSTLSDAQVSIQAGILQGCFTGAQVLTAVLWGKAADASWCGRKPVLVLGLAGTAVSCIGYGFATSFFWSAFWRIFGGGINGTVGIIRTMISEIIKEKKYQSRAFLILPMSFNVANIIGPAMGGFLTNPGTSLPGIFGDGAPLSWQWLVDYPFALPSIINALFLFTATIVVFFSLEETSPTCRGRFDLGHHLASRIRKAVTFFSSSRKYTEAQTWEGPDMMNMENVEHEALLFTPGQPSSVQSVQQRLQFPFRHIWTKNVVLTLVTIAVYEFQLGAFANLWALFLSTPRPIPDALYGQSRPRSSSALSGGLGMPASQVGLATSILGVLGMLLQITLYPSINARLGTLRSFRCFLPGFPITFFLAPFLAVLPSWYRAPEPAGGPLIWIGVVVVLLLQVTARTFTLPASIILLNNCSPHPGVLCTIHGIGQSVSASSRTLGPIVAGWWYGIGLEHKAVEAGWWAIGLVSLLGYASAMWIYEGSGNKMVPEEDEKEASL